MVQRHPVNNMDSENTSNVDSKNGLVCARDGLYFTSDPYDMILMDDTVLKGINRKPNDIEVVMAIIGCCTLYVKLLATLQAKNLKPILVLLFAETNDQKEFDQKEFDQYLTSLPYWAEYRSAPVIDIKYGKYAGDQREEFICATYTDRVAAETSSAVVLRQLSEKELKDIHDSLKVRCPNVTDGEDYSHSMDEAATGALIKTLRAYLKKPNPLILEVGCGYPKLAYAMRESGGVVVANDIGETPINKQQQQKTQPTPINKQQQQQTYKIIIQPKTHSSHITQAVK
jgi:hypothetical protein